MAEPLVIACVKWGQRYGAYYANTLYDMVRRNISPEMDFTFQCFTDDPAGLHPAIAARTLPGDLEGWWNKLFLFKEGIFPPRQRIAYFDLDTLITGPLDGLWGYPGDFALLRDFYRPCGYGSGVMLWRAGACYFLWSRFEAEGRPMPGGGDQAWIEKAYPGADLLQDCFPGLFASYKTDCRPLPPEGTSVVCFHGEPKQDNCGAVWVRDVWKPDARAIVASATIEEESMAHARHAACLPYPWLARLPAHTRHAVIIGSGPSLMECAGELRQARVDANDFFAVNHAPAWLAQAGIACDAQVISGSRAEDAQWVADTAAVCYCASACHPRVLEKAAGRAVLWNACEWAQECSTTGLQAIMLAYALGYRHFHLYGFDSCLHEGREQAYATPSSVRNRVFPFEFQGRKFQVCAWMLKQAEECMRLADTLLREGCSITIHGDGLLHFLAGFLACL